MWKPEEKRQLERTRHRFEDNIKMDLPKVRRVMDWIDLSKDMDNLRAVVNMVMNLCVP